METGFIQLNLFQINKMIKLLWNKYVNTEDNLEFLHAQVTLQKKKIQDLSFTMKMFKYA